MVIRITSLDLPAALLILLMVAPARTVDEPSEQMVAAPGTVQLITRSLQAADPLERIQALAALRELRLNETADAVKELLDDSDPRVRAQVLLTLRNLLTDTEFFLILQKKCRDSSPEVVRHAIALIGKMLKDHPERVDPLIGEFDPAFAREWALAFSQAQSLPAELIQRLLDHTPAIGSAIAPIIRNNPGAAGIDQLVKLRTDPNPWVRAAAIESLATLAEFDRNKLAEHLSDESGIVRRSALRELAAVEIRPEAVEPLLEDSDATVREVAVRVMGDLDSPQAIGQLITRLGDPELLVARTAAEQLAKNTSDSATDALVAALADPREQVVVQALRSLALRANSSAIEHVRPLADHDSVNIRAAAFDTLGSIGSDPIIPWLLEQATNQTGFPRAAINRSLGRLKAADALDHLLADCHYPDKRSKGLDPSLFGPMSRTPEYSLGETAVATAAVQALGELGNPAAVPVLVDVAYDVLRNEAFYSAVVRSLSQLADPRAQPALVQLGAKGTISQGMKMVMIPATTRVLAIQTIAQFDLKSAAGDIRQMDPDWATLPILQAAAETLTRLTGIETTYRLPARLGNYFVEDRATAVDPSVFSRPILHAKAEP